MEILKEIFGGALILMPIFYPVLMLLVVYVVGLYVFRILIPNILNKYKSRLRLKSGTKWHSDRVLLSSLQKMDPTEFEEYVAELYRHHGYTAKAVGHSGDHGVDVEIEKNGVVSYVQCKRYSDLNKVGEPEVRNFLGSLDHKRSSGKGYFVTTGYFTMEAEKFADENLIELIDGPKLIKYMREASISGNS